VGTLSVVAAPNISKSGEPVRFLVESPQPATLHLALYTIAGEEVYQTTLSGNAGLNILTWPLENQSSGPVASGLYIYALSVGEGGRTSRMTGKVLVVR
jgi:hypothetical protein